MRSFDGGMFSVSNRTKLEQFMVDAPNQFGVGLESRMLSEQEHGVKSSVAVGSDRFVAAKTRMDEGIEYVASYEVA